LNHDEFVDLCILCGCDYCDSIDGIGPITAFKLITKYRSLEKVVEHLNDENKVKERYRIPESFNYQNARLLFKFPEVNPHLEVKFHKVNE
jgi:flap endonuclease-1